MTDAGMGSFVDVLMSQSFRTSSNSSSVVGSVNFSKLGDGVAGL